MIPRSVGLRWAGGTDMRDLLLPVAKISGQGQSDSHAEPDAVVGEGDLLSGGRGRRMVTIESGKHGENSKMISSGAWLSMRQRRGGERREDRVDVAAFNGFESLEPRLLMAAQVTAVIVADIDEDAAPQSINLLDHFDDTDIEGTVLEFRTVSGDYFVELFDAILPLTVGNFLNYVLDGDFINSFIHRSVPGFVIQGGAFAVPDGTLQQVPTDPPVVNEFANHALVWGTDANVTIDSAMVHLPAGSDLSQVNVGDRIRLIGRDDGLLDSDFFDIIAVDDAADMTEVSPTPFNATGDGIDWRITPDVNVRGTLSPPKQAGDPDSATGGFFVNLQNNAGNLDIQNDGFAAFGRVLFDGMNVVDAIAALERVNAGQFTTLPVRNFDGVNLGLENLVTVLGVDVVNELAFEVVGNTDPDLATVTMENDNQLSIAPVLNANGEADITVRATGLDGNTADETFTLTVNASNDAPSATDDAYNVIEDGTLNLSAETGVLSNDSDVDGDDLTAILVDDVSNGELTLNADGSFTYAPDGDFNGLDSFTYKANDGTADSDVATVTVDVSNDAPSATDDAYSVIEDGALNLSAEAGVLRNDGDVDGDDLTAILVDDVSNGELTLNADGSFTYAPDGDFNGLDSFTYKANDGTADSDVATVTVDVVSGVSIGVARGKEKVLFNVGHVDVTVKIAGDGQAEVFDLGDLGNGLHDIELTGPSGSTTVTVTTKNGFFDLRNFRSDGSMKAFVAKTTDLHGDMAIAGSIASIAMNNIADQHEIEIGANAEKAVPVSLTFKEIANLSIVSLSPIKALSATRWLDTDADQDVVMASSLQKLTIKGDKKKQIRGQFQADLKLDGTDDSKWTLASAKIADDVDGVNWVFTGDVGTIDIKGNVTDMEVTVMSSLGTFKSGSATNLTIDVDDNIGKAEVASWGVGELTGATAKSIGVKGNKKAGVAGRFDHVKVTLHGAAHVAQALAKLQVTGGSDGATIDIAGDAGMVDFKGSVDSLDLTVASQVRSIKLGDTNRADIEVDKVGTVQALRWLSGNFIAKLVKSIKTTGNKKTGVSGDFGPNVTIHGAPNSGAAVSSTSIKGSVRASTWRVNGPAGAFKTNIIANGFDAAFNGYLKGVTSKGASGGTFAAHSIGSVSVKANMTGGSFTAGRNFGPDQLPDTADDVLAGGEDAFIKKISISGTVPLGILFTAGVLPGTASINGQKVDTVTDSQFVLII